MFFGQVCVLLGLLVLLLFVSFLTCIISTKSHFFNNFVLLIMFKIFIFYVHFYRLIAIFMVSYNSFVVSVTFFTQWHKMPKNSILLSLNESFYKHSDKLIFYPKCNTRSHNILSHWL